MASAASSSTHHQAQQSHTHGQLERNLKAKRNQLQQRISGRLEDVAATREPDDEAALAVNNYDNDLALLTMNRERRELGEIEAALGRLRAGEYGHCEVCGSPIGQARLRALPWARLCIKCAEQRAA